MTSEGIFCIVPVDVTESDDIVVLLHLVEVAVTHTADTDSCDVQFVTGSCLFVFSDRFLCKSKV